MRRFCDQINCLHCAQLRKRLLARLVRAFQTIEPCLRHTQGRPLPGATDEEAAAPLRSPCCAWRSRSVGVRGLVDLVPVELSPPFSPMLEGSNLPVGPARRSRGESRKARSRCAAFLRRRGWRQCCGHDRLCLVGRSVARAPRCRSSSRVHLSSTCISSPELPTLGPEVKY